MSYQNEAWAMSATVITLGTLGASVFPTLVRPPGGAVGAQLKLLGASGSTVQILPHSLSGASIGGATAVGASIAGYPLNAVGVDNTSFTGPAAFYLAATGATATVAIAWRYSASGVTFA